MANDLLKEQRRQRLAFLTERNRDERLNELEALKMMIGTLSMAAPHDPEAWDIYQQARRRIPALRQFLGLPPKPSPR